MSATTTAITESIRAVSNLWRAIKAPHVVVQQSTIIEVGTHIATSKVRVRSSACERGDIAYHQQPLENVARMMARREVPHLASKVGGSLLEGVLVEVPTMTRDMMILILASSPHLVLSRAGMASNGFVCE